MIKLLSRGYSVWFGITEVRTELPISTDGDLATVYLFSGDTPAKAHAKCHRVQSSAHASEHCGSVL